MPSSHRVRRSPFGFFRRRYYRPAYYGHRRSYGYAAPCGPFRLRPCFPLLRAKAVVGTAALGGALIGAGLFRG